ncbi:unnamed protein product [Camellia sinensis]
MPKPEDQMKQSLENSWPTLMLCLGGPISEDLTHYLKLAIS